MRALALAAALALGAPAAAQTLGTAPTVEWFVQNPKARADILLMCANEPGVARRVDACHNAHAASIEATTREANARLGRTSPRTLRYWTDRPEERREHLATCRRLAPEDAAKIWCHQAEAAEQRVAPRAPEPPRARRT